ncbi:MAG: hypothetical protein O3C28_12740 [Proteobacteria bacterium]|nr:hypothetical protein [Pseudomonadota bacterium]
MEPSDANEIAFETSDALCALSLDIVTNCKRTLDITSRHLDPILFDNQAFADSVSQLVRNNRLAKVRLLVLDIGPVVARGHRLMELASRLSSFITIRKPGNDYKNFNEAMLIADTKAYTHRRFADRYDGLGSHNDIRRATDLTGRFDELWERAEPDPNFRRLHI